MGNQLWMKHVCFPLNVADLFANGRALFLTTTFRKPVIARGLYFAWHTTIFERLQLCL